MKALNQKITKQPNQFSFTSFILNSPQHHLFFTTSKSYKTLETTYSKLICIRKMIT